MFSLSDSPNFWLYTKPTDIRKSFFTLSGLVCIEMKMDTLCGDVFVFINKRRNRIKLLHMEPGGLVLYSKLLEEGTFHLPRYDANKGEISIEWRDLVMMVERIYNDPNTRLQKLKRYKKKVKNKAKNGTRVAYILVFVYL